MAADRSYVAENQAQLTRLEAAGAIRLSERESEEWEELA